MKIKELTPEQIAELPAIREEWLKISFSCEPADRPMAEDAIIRAYAMVDLAPPKIHWADGPLEGAMLVGTLQAADVGGDPMEYTQQALHSIFYGQQDTYWLAYYNALGRFGLQEEVAPLEPLMDLAKSCGWCYLYRGHVVACERHSELHREDTFLHKEDGPALKYPNGEALFMWRGMRVPEWIIMEPEKITAKVIQDETNVELRRVMMERLGEGKYIEELGAKPVHKDEWGGQEYLLYRAAVAEEEEELVMVRVINSTPEPDGTRSIYWLRVPPATQTCKEAVAWTFDLSEEEYTPMIET